MINPAQLDYTNTPASPSRPSMNYRPADPTALPVVSIVTPFFNAGSVFHETASTVFRQSLQQWEWLIINDGSTEPEALRILDEYRRKDPRIRVVDHSANKGLSAARNTGFKEAKAEFVFQLDADDLIEPTTLEQMAWHLTTHPHVAFTTGFTVGFGSLQYLWRNGFHNGAGFLDENQVTATCMVRKSVHQAVGGYDEEIRGGLEDWDFWLKAAAHGHWGDTIPEFLDWYRRRDMGREHWRNLVEKEKFEKFHNRLRQRYSGLWEKFPQIEIARQQLATSVNAELPFRNQLAKEKRRLLLIVPHFELGGADKFNLNLIEQLQRQHGYEVTVVATKHAKNVWQHEFERLTPDVFALNNFVHYTDFPLFLRYLIASRQPDVVCLSNSHVAYQLLPYLRAHFPDLPFVDYLHMEQEDWMSGGYPRCSIVYQSQLARTVVASEHLKRWMVARGADEKYIDVCYINIDTDLWSRGRFDTPALTKKWSVDPDRPVVLYAGRICDQKQPKVFGNVMRRLARKHPAFTALVAGDGPDLPHLKEFVESEHLRQVRFLGAVPNEAMAELLAISDIFFLPSQWEGISLAMYEAMAMEVVPLGADVGGQRELVTPDGGILVRHGPNEEADYTNALQKLLKSPELRKRMATAARERVQRRFDIKDLGRCMNEIFDAARASLNAAGRDSVLSCEQASLHATEVIEQLRMAQYADGLHHEREQLLPYVKQSIQWQSALKTGQTLAELGQDQAAIRSLEDGIKAAIASRMADIELSARVEISKALVPLDCQLAVATLAGALPLAEQLRSPEVRRAVEQGLKKLTAMLNTTPQTSDRAPIVSVVIPCYKQAHFLADAVESVVAQTFSDWEIIIVNDGSPDNTSEVARRLIAKHAGKRIQLVEKPNGGLPSARNAGIRAARGKYILPLDADDKIKPTMLAKLVPLLDAHPKVGFAYTHIQHFGALDTEFPLPDFDRATLVAKDNIACVCSLFRKSAWEQVGGYNEAMREGYEDWDFWIGCVEHGWDGYCLHEPLFLYRKSGQSMLTDANQKRERLVAQIVLNHPKLYDEPTRQRAKGVLDRHAAAKAAETAQVPAASANATPSVVPGQPRLRISYLISSILGVTGGNQTLLRQAEEMRRRGHDVTIVTYTPKPDWFQFETRVVQVPAGQPMAPCVPPSDVVVATYFTNAHELRAVTAPVKAYYAQGDQFVFADAAMADTEQNRQLRELSRASYLLPGIRFVPNSRNLANAVEKLCGRRADAILPVCTDQTIFRPLQRSLPGSRFRLLVVGPDARGTDAEPLLFKGIQDIHDALQILAQRYPHFTAVRMSNTPPDIFARFPCEFYVAPSDEMKTVLFGASHILIYASHYDSCPRPPQEAMAAGCAVVCTATPGAMEYCRDGENSLLVPIQSPAAIADAVERLIKDHALREKLVQGGLATAQEYLREREWNEWEKMLQRFTDETAGKAAKPATVGSPKSPGAAKPVKAASIKLPPCALAGHIGEARELLQRKKFREAWETTRTALAVRPFHPEAYLLLAEIAQAAGDSASARHCAEHARRLAPGWKPARRFLNQRLKGNAHPDWLALPDSMVNRPSPVTSRLTVCLIARNEEQFIGRCLASVRGLADQIVVVDTGSTDRTVEIAEEHGAEVHSFAWCDDFSAARNSALEHVRGDWVLVLDADEELTAEGREAILQEMRASDVIAYRLPIVDVGKEDEGCHYVPRLFRNAPGLFYVGRIHEQVFSSVEVRREEWGMENKFSQATLLHHGYTEQVNQQRDKNARNLRLLELAVGEMPGEPNLLMNYGLELARAGKPDAALDQYRKAFRALEALPAEQVVPELRESLLTQLCTQLMAAKKYEELVQMLDTPLAQRGGLTASLHFGLGLTWMELKDFRKAAEQFRQCLAKRDQPSLTPMNRDIRKAGPQHCLATCLMHLREFDGAAEAFQQALAADPQSRPVRFDFAAFLFSRGLPVEALQQLHALVAEKADESSVWLLGGRIALSEPQFSEFACDWTGEAIKQFPQDRAIALQRAEALLLGERVAEALPLWRQAAASGEAAHRAAQIVCELAAGEPVVSVPSSDEPAVSREFLKWYRRLIAAGRTQTVAVLNDRLKQTADALPTAGKILGAALAEAQSPTAAATAQLVSNC